MFFFKRSYRVLPTLPRHFVPPLLQKGNIRELVANTTPARYRLHPFVSAGNSDRMRCNIPLPVEGEYPRSACRLFHCRKIL